MRITSRPFRSYVSLSGSSVITNAPIYIDPPTQSEQGVSVDDEIEDLDNRIDELEDELPFEELPPLP